MKIYTVRMHGGSHQDGLDVSCFAVAKVRADSRVEAEEQAILLASQHLVTTEAYDGGEKLPISFSLDVES